ncbi:enoyl-CoA hydratase/isomerase [Paenibacillus apiarius]|uniref:enoyl-CoA hydratase/isomerase n=1 Tax=Paenibacillus apiarius TaxID=46240 RepID=UPI0019821DDB|nr:enoyl-CoA hydratase/isomerase [Paenibacillus apiarius]MBN3526387.1 enoyl-CoA hydratase/isomerase [Paenibacillus apiarius]
MDWKTIKVRFEESICFVQFNRPEAKNTIDALLIEECHQILRSYEDTINIVVFEGLPEVFCFGADFQGIHSHRQSQERSENNPAPLYDLWLKMTTGSFITISHVRGQTNAGGVGFVAASDIVLADDTATFSMSELLFGLFPAMVLPFLIRRIGFQRAHYLTLMTKPIPAQQAYNWGLVDAYQEKSENLLRQHLSRLKKLPKAGIEQYKNYMARLNDTVFKCKEIAIAANLEIFSDPRNLEKIYQFAEKGIYPWEG